MLSAAAVLDKNPTAPAIHGRCSYNHLIFRPPKSVGRTCVDFDTQPASAQQKDFLLKKSAIAFCAGLISASVLNHGLARAEQTLPQSFEVRAQKTILYDIVKFGGALFAPGERGVILTTTDSGERWKLFSNVPTNRALTSIVFVDQKVIVVAGHGGTVFRTEDGGGVWKKIDLPEIGKDSILGSMKSADGRLFLYGAFGLFLVSADAGKSWSKHSIIDETFDRHVSRVLEFPDRSLFVVGESGTAAISHDAGKTWKKLNVGYQGSLFGALYANDGSILVYGMRGNVFRSTDGGETWSQATLDTKSTINAGVISEDGTIALVGNNGLVLVSNDNGRSFKILSTAEGGPLSGVHVTEDGRLVYVGYLTVGVVDAGK
jgi:photosystem II stability/assembly factor-like uncharacterized protein